MTSRALIQQQSDDALEVLFSTLRYAYVKLTFFKPAVSGKDFETGDRIFAT